MKCFAIATMISGALMLPAVYADDTIHDRKENQQDRIAQGIQSGRLNAAQAANLETKEHKLNQRIADDREDHGGKLTAAEKKQVNRRQNRLSRQIYKDKQE